MVSFKLTALLIASAFSLHALAIPTPHGMHNEILSVVGTRRQSSEEPKEIGITGSNSQASEGNIEASGGSLANPVARLQASRPAAGQKLAGRPAPARPGGWDVVMPARRPTRRPAGRLGTIPTKHRLWPGESLPASAHARLVSIPIAIAGPKAHKLAHRSDGAGTSNTGTSNTSSNQEPEKE